MLSVKDPRVHWQMRPTALIATLPGAAVTDSVVVAAVAGVDWEKVSVRRGYEERERLTRVVGEQSRGRGLAEEDGEGSDDGDGELVHCDGCKGKVRLLVVVEEEVG